MQREVARELGYAPSAVSTDRFNLDAGAALLRIWTGGRD
jgi:hypothetical protein